MSEIDEKATVGDLVAERLGRARVFERLGIDYCCGGKKPLDDACAEKGLDTTAVVRQLLASDAEQSATDRTDWRTASLSELADHIVTVHHTYLRQALPRLSYLLDKVARAHGERHPELSEVQRVFEGLRGELETHMVKEERILFPLCRRMEVDILPDFLHGTIRNPIWVMERDHEEAGEALARLRELTHDFTPPADACNTYRVLLNDLAELEADLHQHIHKENNILFPRAIEREARLATAP